MSIAERLAKLSPAERERLEARLRAMREQPQDDAVGRLGAEEAPLSLMQELFANLERGGVTGSAYNVPTALRVRGPFDLGRLQGALGALVARHEILRTTFAERDGARVQRVGAPLPVLVRCVDRTAVPESARDEDARTRLCEAASIPFDLTADLLVRAVVLRYAPDDHALLLTCHHVASDVQSRALLFSELAALYDGASLPAPPLQYADFAAWQRARFDDAERARVLAARRERLDGAPESTGLPTDFPRTLVPQFAGARRSAVLPRALGEAMLATARTLGVTPFVAFYAAFATLVHRLAGESDIAIGSVFAGRPRPEFGGMLGCFAHVLPLRTTVEDDPTFAAFAARAGRAFFDAAEDADVPLDAAPWPGMPRLATIFTLVDGAQAAEPVLGDCTLEPIAFDRGVAKVEFALSVRLAPGGVVLEAEYRTDLFAAASMDVLLARYRRVLEAIVADPARPISALPLMDAAERERVLALGMPAPRPYPRDHALTELIDAAAVRTPSALAVVGPEATFTYAQLVARSQTIAADLRARGVGRGTLVGVCLERTAAMVAALLGVLRAGAAYVPLDPGFPVARLGMMVADGDVAVIVSESSLEPLVTDLLGHAGREGAARPANVYLCDVPNADLASDASGAAAAPPAATDLAYVLFTSGSTGRPKGVAVTHRSLVNFLTSMAREPGIAAHDTVPAITTLSFDIAGLELWLPLIVGARTVIVPRAATLDGAELGALLRTCGATLVQATPATWRLLLEAGWSGGDGLRMLCGGEALDAHLARALLACGSELWNVYGPTETTIWSTLSRVRPDEPISLGEPLANTRLYVLEPSGEPAPVGVAGELAIGGDGVAVGYLGAPERSAERFVPDPFAGEPDARMYRTGDLVRRRANGRLEFLGRRDGQVKVRGFRIELGDVEAALAAHPDVAQAVALVRTDDGTEARLVAYLLERRPVSDQDLRTSLRDRVPPYMLPSSFVRLAAIPLTANGKVDRRALPAPAPDAARERTAPRNEGERVVRESFARALDREPDTIDVNDDFFALGGHSLLAMRLAALLEERFRSRVPLASIFAEPSVAKLAARLGPYPDPDDLAPAASPALARIDRERAPLTAAQEALWIFEQRTPGTAAYHIPVLRRIDGPLDDAAFVAALDAVVARHEPLRARFFAGDDEPYQTFSSSGPPLLALHDVRAIADDAARDAAARTLLGNLARLPFDLAAGPPVRAASVRTGETTRLFLFVAHHLVFDGGSVDVLLRDLRRAYDAIRSGSPLPAMPVRSFGDLAAHERATVDRAELAASWARTLAGAPTRVELPTDRSNPRDAWESATCVVVFPAALAQALERRARAEGATLFMVLLAAYGAVLSRYARTDDVVVGSAIGDRGSAGGDLVGFLTNTVPLRLQLSGDPSFAELVARVRTTCVEAYDRRAYTGTVAFSTMFLLQEPARPHFLGDAELAWDALTRDATPFDLVLSTSVGEAGLRASLAYRTDLFDEATVRGMLAALETLLTSVAADANTSLSRLPLVCAAERRALLAIAREAVTEPAPEFLPQMLAAQARRTPDAVAMIDEFGRSYTYGVLAAWSGALRLQLEALGVRRGSLVGLLSERSPELVAATLAVLDAGAAYMPLDPKLPAERSQAMIADAGLAVIVAQSPLVAQARASRLPLLALDPTPLASDAAPRSAVAVDAGDLAYVIYTSGSTGAPKGVAVSHGSLANYMQWMRRALPMAPGEQFLYRTPIGFDPGVSYTFAPLTCGAVLRVGESALDGDARGIAALAAREPIAVLEATPTLLRMLLDEPDLARARSLRMILVGGEALAGDTARRLREMLPDVELVNLYGPTEATIAVTFHRCAAGDVHASVPIGRALDNVRLYVASDAGELVPRGVPGELWIGGTAVALGYRGQEELTARRFIADPFAEEPGARVYRSGDVVRMRATGVLEYLGRSDDQVKVRGYRIELGEIEAVLVAIPDVVSAAVVVRAHPSGEPELVAFYAASTPGPSTSVVRERLRALLPRYMVPAAIVRRESFALSPNGKIDRRVLPAATDADRGISAVRIAPRNAQERLISQAFAEILGCEAVGVEDDFFDLGGHSLHAMRLVARVQKTFRVPVSLREFFERASVAGVLALLERDEPKPGHAAARAHALETVAAMTPEERARRREKQPTR